MKKINVLSLFDGISTGLYALKSAGFEVQNYYAAEIEKTSIQISKYNFPEIIRLGDVNDWQNWDIDWSSIDLLIGGSPCQSFSFAGKKTGLDGKSGLFLKYVEILENIKKYSPNVKFLLENVKMKDEWKNYISDTLKVQSVRINSCDFSAQRRDRLYWCNWNVRTDYEKSNETIRDILDIDDGKHNLSYQHWQGFLKSYKWKHCELDGKSAPVLASYYKQPPHCPYIPCDSSPSGFRRLLPIECERLQKLPDNFTQKGVDENGNEIYMSETARYKAVGNGWTANVISWLFSCINN